jgi:hypothetical protein
LFAPPLHGQRIAIVAVLVVPLVAVVLLSAPAWLTWPFLPAERRTTVLEFLDRLIEWSKVLAGITGAATATATATATNLDVQPLLPTQNIASPLSASTSNVITAADLTDDMGVPSGASRYNNY